MLCHHLQLGSRTPSSWIQTHNAPLRGSDLDKDGSCWVAYMYLLAHHHNATIRVKMSIVPYMLLVQWNTLTMIPPAPPTQINETWKNPQTKQLINHQSPKQPAACVEKNKQITPMGPETPMADTAVETPLFFCIWPFNNPRRSHDQTLND